jgi:hypothetical protein
MRSACATLPARNVALDTVMAILPYAEEKHPHTA